MELPTRYEPQAAEADIYARWLEAGCFRATPDSREKRYCDCAAAKRDRCPPSGTRPQPHDYGHAGALAPDAGLQHADFARHGPRRNRDAECGGEADSERGPDPL